MIKNIFTHRPTEISGAIMAWVNFLIITHTINLDAVGAGALNLALGSTLILFVKSTTNTNAAMNELNDAINNAPPTTLNISPGATVVLPQTDLSDIRHSASENPTPPEPTRPDPGVPERRTRRKPLTPK